MAKSMKRAGQTILRILGTANPFETPGSAVFYSVQLLTWLTVVILLSIHHEPWRDEVRALSIAIQPHWWWQLPAALKNEGHPVLWYLMLRLAHDLFHSPVVLKGVSVAVGFLASALLVWRAPFPGWWKSLFIWSFLPLYEYSVIARNYGISMLLMFTFAAVYPAAKRQPYLLALVLALLANTNVHSLPLVVGLVAFWVWDEVLFSGHSERLKTLVPLIIPVSMVLLCVLGALLTCLPQAGYLPPGASAPGVHRLLSALGTSLVHPGLAFAVLLPYPEILRDILVWGLVVGLMARPALAAIFALYAFTLQTLFLTVYHGGLRQQGLLLAAAVACYWLARDGRTVRWKAPGLKGLAVGLQRFSVFGVLSFVLLTHIWLSRGPIRLDWNRPFSSSKALATLLHEDPRLRDATIVPEPAYLLQSLPYYADNRVFLPRAGRFGRIVPYSGFYRKSLTLGRLLEDALKLKAGSGKPVLIVIGYGGWPSRSAGTIRSSDGRTFSWNQNELSEFKASTRLVASFHKALTDENYDVYALTR